MSEFSIAQVRNLQDKTSLKGVYLFLSISIVILILTLTPGVEISGFLNPIDNFEVYIVIISVSSILTAVFYYFQIEVLFLKVGLKLAKEKFPDYPEFRKYKDVKFYNSIDHLYLSDIKNKFFSKLLFVVSLLFLMFSFIKEPTFALIIIFFAILIFFFLIWLIFDGRSLFRNLKLVFYMKLLIQDNSMVKQEIPKEFIINLKNNLWFEARHSFSHFLERHIGELIQPRYIVIEHFEILEKFKQICLYFYDRIKIQDDEKVNYFLSKMNEVIYFSDANLYKYNFLKRIKASLEFFDSFITSINSWDGWLKELLFHYDDFQIDYTTINALNENLPLEEIEEIDRFLQKDWVTSQVKREVFACTTLIIKKFSTQVNASRLRFFTEKLFLTNYIDNLKEMKDHINNWLKVGIILKKRSTKEIFEAFKEVIIFCIEKYYNYDNPNREVWRSINTLRKYKNNLFNYSMEMHFPTPEEVFIRFKFNFIIYISFRTWEGYKVEFRSPLRKTDIIEHLRYNLEDLHDTHRKELNINEILELNSLLKKSQQKDTF